MISGCFPAFRLDGTVQEPQSEYGAEGFTSDQRQSQSYLTPEPVHKEHQRDVEHQLPHYGVKHGSLAVADGLHAVGGMVVQELHGGGWAPQS